MPVYSKVMLGSDEMSDIPYVNKDDIHNPFNIP